MRRDERPGQDPLEEHDSSRPHSDRALEHRDHLDQFTRPLCGHRLVGWHRAATRSAPRVAHEHTHPLELLSATSRSSSAPISKKPLAMSKAEEYSVQSRR